MRGKTRHQGDFESKLDRNHIDLLLNLRRVGWSYNSLSSFFGISSKGIRYQCEKYGIFSEEYGMRIPDIREARELGRWKYIEGEKINKGKSYADYLKESKNRFPSSRR